MDRRKVLSSLVAGLSLPLAPIQLAEAAATFAHRLHHLRRGAPARRVELGEPGLRGLLPL